MRSIIITNNSHSESVYRAIIFLAVLAPAILSGSPAVNPDVTFGDSLSARRFHHKALIEYRRALFHGSPDSLELNIRIGDTHRKLNHPAQAQIWFEKTIDGGSRKIAKKAHFRLIELDLKNKKPRLARYELSELGKEDFCRQDSSHWEFLWALTYVYSLETDTAKIFVSRIQKTSPYYQKAALIGSAIQDYEKIPRKNPYLALGLAGLIPGSGQFYAGKKIEGVGAFILNGGLMALMGYSVFTGYNAHREGRVKERQVAIMDFSLLFTGIFMRYYQGGKLNAYRHAMEHNDKVQENFLNRVSEISGFDQ